MGRCLYVDNSIVRKSNDFRLVIFIWVFSHDYFRYISFLSSFSHFVTFEFGRADLLLLRLLQYSLYPLGSHFHYWFSVDETLSFPVPCSCFFYFSPLFQSFNIRLSIDISRLTLKGIIQIDRIRVLVQCCLALHRFVKRIMNTSMIDSWNVPLIFFFSFSFPRGFEIVRRF